MEAYNLGMYPMGNSQAVSSVWLSYRCGCTITSGTLDSTDACLLNSSFVDKRTLSPSGQRADFCCQRALVWFHYHNRIIELLDTLLRISHRSLCEQTGHIQAFRVS
eukprot:2600885-Rhodomonas_salina.3